MEALWVTIASDDACFAEVERDADRSEFFCDVGDGVVDLAFVVACDENVVSEGNDAKRGEERPCAFQNAQGSESVKHRSERIALSNTAAADDIDEPVRVEEAQVGVSMVRGVENAAEVLGGLCFADRARDC